MATLPTRPSPGYAREGERYRRQLQEYKQQRDLEFFDKYGYFPQQAAGVRQAQEAGQAEYERLIEELQGGLSRLDEDAVFRSLQEELGATMSGTGVPYTPDILNTLVSQATDPLMRGAQTGLSRLRESFASRGLGRSGGLGGLEQQIMQEAIARASSQGAGIRAQGATENYAARERARAESANLYGVQAGLRNQLLGQIAGFRAQKQFDPSFFAGGQNQGYVPPGTRYDYTPPPSIERRRVGTSAPKYTTALASFGRK